MRNFNFRKFFWFGMNRNISIEFAGFNHHPTIGIDIDGPERGILFFISFGLWFSVRFDGFLPKWLTPKYISSYDGSIIPDEREIKISFFDWCLNWSFWMKPHEWNSTDSKLRRGSIDFQRLLKGKHTCEWIPINTIYREVQMLEGKYPVRAIENQRIDRLSRWFTKKSISYEVSVGRMVGNEFKEEYIPIEGKGENSWDCGESGRGSSSFPKKNENYYIRDIEEAVLHFEADVKYDRIRYGGINWIPREYREKMLDGNE